MALSFRASLRVPHLLRFISPSPSPFLFSPSPRPSLSLSLVGGGGTGRWFSGSRPALGIPNPIVPTEELLDQRKTLTTKVGQDFRANNFDEVIKTYQCMEPDDLKIARSKALRTVMAAYVKLKKFNEGIASFDHIFTYRHLHKDDISSFCIVIDCCANLNKFPKAKRYFEKIRPLDRDGKAAIAMIEGSLKMGKFKEASNYLDELVEERKKPTQRIFNSFIHHHIQKEKFNEAFQYFEQMEQMGLKGDVYTFSILMSACTRAGKPAKALRFFEEMMKRGLSADQVIYSSLLTACVKAKRPDKAIKYFEEMEEHFISNVSCQVLNVMILAYTEEKGLMESLRFGEKMLFEKGISPDTSTLNTMLSLYFKACLFDKAFQFLEDLKGQGIAPDVITYTSILGGCLQTSNEKFDMYLQEMSKRGIKPNQKTYHTLLHACSQNKDLKKALALLKLMDESGSADLITYNSVLNVCKRLGDSVRAKHYYQELLRKNFTPDGVTFNLLLKAMLNAQNNETTSYYSSDDSLTLEYLLTEMRKWEVRGDSNFCKKLENYLRQEGSPETLTECLSQHGVERELNERPKVRKRKP